MGWRWLDGAACWLEVCGRTLLTGSTGCCCILFNFLERIHLTAVSTFNDAMTQVSLLYLTFL